MLAQYEEALEAIDVYIQRSEYPEEGYYWQCKAYIGLNDLEAAYTSLKKCVELDSEYYYYIYLEDVKALVGYSDFDEVFSEIHMNDYMH